MPHAFKGVVDGTRTRGTRWRDRYRSVPGNRAEQTAKQVSRVRGRHRVAGPARAGALRTATRTRVLTIPAPSIAPSLSDEQLHDVSDTRVDRGAQSKRPNPALSHGLGGNTPKMLEPRGHDCCPWSTYRRRVGVSDVVESPSRQFSDGDSTGSDSVRTPVSGPRTGFARATPLDSTRDPRARASPQHEHQ